MTKTDNDTAMQCPAPACDLGESLIWDEHGRCFWWVDVHAGTLYRGALDGSRAQHWQFDEALGHVALTERDDSVLLGLASGLTLFDFTRASATRLIDVPHAAPGMRLNDGRCDRHGHLVFGTMSEGGAGQPGAFWRFGARSGLRRLDLPPPAIPNSICFSPDGRLLYFTDSKLKVIMVCDYDPDSGAVGGARVFADPGEVAWEPDGSCVDAAGGLWNAQWGGQRVVRYDAAGRIDRVLASPAWQPTCPCLGGAGLDTLYATSASHGLAAARRSAADGAILCWPLAGLEGLPEGRVSGL